MCDWPKLDQLPPRPRKVSVSCVRCGRLQEIRSAELVSEFVHTRKMVKLTRKQKILIAVGSAAVVLAVVLGASLGTRKGGDSSTPTTAGNPLENSNATTKGSTVGA